MVDGEGDHAPAMPPGPGRRHQQQGDGIPPAGEGYAKGGRTGRGEALREDREGFPLGIDQPHLARVRTAVARFFTAALAVAA